ncbi:hypothetical protein [Rhizorhabdus dicambivorans]|uniref:Uncharacterized protein n=1 Tax=Rhizorhabdus dicambivorans TaxID=1850238 RepID=A0A2A4FZ55_9SPHN|nr:hypothetical protein [Rhizorhabdus dicambivorans]ATE64810.1 hypothetical protein CMV14_10710 [Rhizorhabdus dicambivorans]PCE44087.1 hypothetical protein COO09_00095 [Rhizorhabdus dicambivorans]
MAYLQSELPPSTAPAKPLAVHGVSPAPIAIPAPAARWPARIAARFGAVLAAMLALFFVGQAAARATESLAIGIIAADLVFLLVVAGWSTVAVSSLRR